MPIGNVFNIVRVPELRRRILFSLALLAVYRVGIFITVPGVNRAAMRDVFKQSAGGFLGLFNMFSGGAMETFSIFSLGIMPYISASIILQLLTVVVPSLEKIQKEGQSGQKKINQYTRYGTVVLSLVQAFIMAQSFEGRTGAMGTSVAVDPGIGFKLLCMMSLTTGTAFIMWLGEQITERGIGNGISLVIFAGIVAAMPSAVATTFEFVRRQELSILIAIFIAIVMVGVVAAIIYMERAQRRIAVQYAKRVVGRRMYSGQSSHLPLKINTSGVIPPIFASSILLFPGTVTGFIDHPVAHWVQQELAPGSWLYNLVYVVLIVLLCYFYTAVTFNPADVADNMKKFGGYVPGIRPGPRTAEYIDRILTRITLPGALYVAAICVLPTILISQFKVPFYFGGTALLIVVGVALDTVSAIEPHMITRSYEGFMKRGRIRGRR